MSKIADAVEDFLDNGGRELGYSSNNLPDLDDFQLVLQQLVKVWEYYGVTEYEYYGGGNE